MLVTPSFTFLSLVFNLGTLLLLHGSDPNLVTTKRNLQRSIQTIGSAATEGWNNIAMHYRDILSAPPASSGSFPFVGRAEWIYRGCAVRIIRFLDGPAPHSSHTSSSSHSSTSLSIPVSTDITVYTSFPPTCSIYTAPFVVDWAEHPWEAPRFTEMRFPCFWSLVPCILVSSVTCIWFKARKPSGAPGVEIEPTYKVDNNDSVLPPSSYIGSVATFMDSDSNSELDTKCEPQALTTNVNTTSLPRSLPVIVTTSNGRVLFNAEIILSSNQIISTSPSSVKFTVDVVAFQNLTSCNLRRHPHYPERRRR
ncbi:hypothetical protein BDM02DRAFT_3123884 [Thelephora ganbajun]|uniref:Uncharacterized protein n=1 Tax=Thelephora ganbajun TaxID=370292 RepID=A0ACB6Z0N3_THEGA|nr:hypothetical protein BDM02DRAFT_3123884 [Thelephora ganbajun]